MSAALDLALQLVEEGERDPVRAVQNQVRLAKALKHVKRELVSQGPANDILPKLLERLIERLERLLEATMQPLAALGVTHIVRVDDVPTLNAGQTSPTLKIDWPGGQGTARSMFAGNLDGDAASLSRVSVRIAINGSDELFTTGAAPAFVPLVVFQAATHNWFRLKDYGDSPAQKWTVVFKHEGPAGSPASTPFLLFGFVKGK
jgi:hypothetical protein